jgi:hypothetical protein
MEEHKNCYKKAANEAIGIKNTERRNFFRIWNEKIKNSI